MHNDTKLSMYITIFIHIRLVNKTYHIFITVIYKLHIDYIQDFELELE